MFHRCRYNDTHVPSVRLTPAWSGLSPWLLLLERTVLLDHCARSALGPAVGNDVRRARTWSAAVTMVHAGARRFVCVSR